MQVILRKDVQELGLRGQTVTVAAGVARNYLLPTGLAVAATEARDQKHSYFLKASTDDLKIEMPTKRQAELMAAAEALFGDRRAAQEWLHEPIPSLDRRRPIEMIQGSAEDRKRVYSILGRIEHGLF